MPEEKLEMQQQKMSSTLLGTLMKAKTKLGSSRKVTCGNTVKSLSDVRRAFDVKAKRLSIHDALFATKAMLDGVHISSRADNDDNHDNDAKKEDKIIVNADLDNNNDDIDEFEQSLMSCIVREDPNVSWNDVCGLQIAKAQLKEAVILPMKYPQLFTGKRQPWRGILLYGPPGTGKSYLAKAVATEANSTFFSVSSSDLVSKFQGESEKLVRALFELARKESPSVVFIDEIDSLCSARNSNEGDNSKRIKTEFLVQMQGVGKIMEGVLVLGATNDPSSIDPAMRRRFQKRIYISLPNDGARADMFQNNLHGTPNLLTEEDFVRLSSITSGYSGDDIKNVVRDALMEPLREALTSNYFVYEEDQDGNAWWFPCTRETEGCREVSMHELPDDQVQCASVCVAHFLTSLMKTKPTVGQSELVAYEDWTRQFGQSGGDGNNDDEVNEEAIGADRNNEAHLPPQQQQQQQQAFAPHPFPPTSASSSATSSPMSSGVIAFLQQHDFTMQKQLELQQEIVLRLKKQQRELSAWQERLEQWEKRLAERDMHTNNKVRLL
jgi:vacuolar protein-sorting-associated protein 4